MSRAVIEKSQISEDILILAYSHMTTAKAMSEKYENNAKFTSKYVHATSRGHEAIQLAVGMQLQPQDFVAPYYRDDSILLSIGCTPYELMLQLMAKRDDPFSGGRSYYSHPSLRDDDKPKIPHQSSATGMQAIPTTGIAMGIQHIEDQDIKKLKSKNPPIVVCSLGDASVTEGEVSEAFQMAALRQLPIIYLVQDNEWDISAHADEIRAMDSSEYVKGFPGIEIYKLNGTNFLKCYPLVKNIINKVRHERKPILLHAKVPLLSHHTSGVRKEWYRDDLDYHKEFDPFPFFKHQLIDQGISEDKLNEIEGLARKRVDKDFEKARKAEDPRPEDLFNYDFAPTPITEEKGEREPKDGEMTLMVDAALHSVEELMKEHEECLLYGQDVGMRLGGVFREAATLAEKFGKDRVFNTAIQEAFIIGSTVGMSATGLKPIVEVQFADYIWPGLNQLFTEVSRSYYLSNGKWPVSNIIRVPIGAYGSGGPYHSSSVESVICNIKGIKVAYPSNAADMKGLMKSAYYDPNPVVMFEHKGLYWSKVEGTEAAKCIEPSSDYVIPFGKGRVALSANNEQNSRLTVVCYGMGVHWALNAAQKFEGQVEIIDLRTLHPLDTELIFKSVRKNNRCLVITEEAVNNSFAQSIAARIQESCFESLDAPVKTIGSENLPAIPLNTILEKTMIPSVEKVEDAISEVLNY